MKDISFEIITSRKNRRIISVCALSDKKERDRRGLFCAEGIKLLSELISEKVEICELYFTDRAFSRYSAEIELCASNGTEVFEVSAEVYEKMSAEKNPEGIFAVAKKTPVYTNVENTPGDGGFLVLDGVQNPLNVGTVIRTASALGISRILLGEGCADIFNHKTLRAAMGTLFKVNICVTDDLAREIKKLSEMGTVYGAALDKTSCDIRSVKFEKNDSVILGNEGNGISEEILSLCDKKVIIPMQQNTESLNAATAAAIIMWEKQKGQIL